MKINVTSRSLFAIGVLLAATASWSQTNGSAADLSPEALVRKVTSEVLDAIQKDDALKAGDREKALALAEEKVLPHIDFREMTRLAVGKAWRSATPQQQDVLTSEFRELLVRTYASAIDAYRGQSMRVLPTRMAAGATEVTVRNLYLKPGRPPVPVDYYMLKTAKGWKVADILVEGVSLVLTYRTEFEEEARRGGVEGLIKRLQAKNRTTQSGPQRPKV
jgi:phospholipid transport system substrate-binding protein